MILAGGPASKKLGDVAARNCAVAPNRQNNDLQPVERRKPVSYAFGTRLETSRATLPNFDNGASSINGTMFEDSQDHLDYKIDSTFGVADGGWTTVETGSGAYDGHAHSDYSDSGSYSNLTTDANGWSVRGGSLDEYGYGPQKGDGPFRQIGPVPFLRPGDKTVRPNRHRGQDIFDNITGRGARFDGDGNFIGFLEP